jgi:hypothetical protein
VLIHREFPQFTLFSPSYHAFFFFLFRWGDNMSLWNWAANGPIVHLPGDTWVNMEQRWNDIDRGRPKDSEKILTQCHFVHHKSHMDCPGREPATQLVPYFVVGTQKSSEPVACAGNTSYVRPEGRTHAMKRTRNVRNHASKMRDTVTTRWRLKINTLYQQREPPLM